MGVRRRFHISAAENKTNVLSKKRNDALNTLSVPVIGYGLEIPVIN